MDEEIRELASAVVGRGEPGSEDLPLPPQPKPRAVLSRRTAGLSGLARSAGTSPVRG